MKTNSPPTPCVFFSALFFFRAGVRMPCGRIKPWLDQIRRSTTESWRGTTINWKKLWVLSSTARSPSYTEPCQLRLRKHNGNLRHTHTRLRTDTQKMSSCCSVKPTQEQLKTKLYHTSHLSHSVFVLSHLKTVTFLKDSTVIYNGKWVQFLQYCSLFDSGNYHHVFLFSSAFWQQLCVCMWGFLIRNRATVNSTCQSSAVILRTHVYGLLHSM